VSAFRDVAEIFFFDLMRRVDEQHVQLRLLTDSGDGLLLGRLIQCASIVVECAGSHHPLVDRMARLLARLCAHGALSSRAVCAARVRLRCGGVGAHTAATLALDANARAAVGRVSNVARAVCRQRRRSRCSLVGANFAMT
jgi:hypothetical protein